MSLVKDIDFEIIVAGQTKQFISTAHMKLIEAVAEAEGGRIAALRNKCAEEYSGNILVFLDDDIIFEPDWCEKLKEYSQNNSWDILGNRILLPNGDRYWDRAIINPHQMVPYDFDDEDSRLYQTGCFWIIRHEVFNKHPWNSGIEYYAERNGGINEDVEYSMRLITAGFKLKFDATNTVWHWDDSYRQIDIDSSTSRCVKEYLVPAKDKKEFKHLEHFTNLLNSL